MLCQGQVTSGIGSCAREELPQRYGNRACDLGAPEFAASAQPSLARLKLKAVASVKEVTAFVIDPRY